MFINDAFSKVDRANKHIRALCKAIEEFSETEFYTFEPKVYPPDGGVFRLYFNLIRQPPHDLALIVGDTVHNLRSALDIATSAVTKNTGTDFPFHETRENLSDALVNGKAKVLPSALKDIILNDIKPYKAGNYRLWAMNKLDNIDKHQLIIPVVSVSQIKGYSVYDEITGHFTGEMNVTIHQDSVYLPLWHEVLEKGRPILKDKGEASLNILFGKGQFFENEFVVDTLQLLSHEVIMIVEKFKRFVTS